MRFMEESGVGMDTYRSLREKYNLPLPIIRYKKPNLIVSFPRSSDAVRDVFTNRAVDKLTDEELIGYEWIRAQGEVATKNYAEHFGYTQRTASRHLKKLLSVGLIKTNGEKSTSPKLRYSVAK